MGLLHHLADEPGLAQKYGALAYQLFVEITDRIGQVYGLTLLGHVYASSSASAEARSAYRQAIALGQTMGHDYLLMESHAGLARLGMAVGDVARSAAEIGVVVDYLQTHSLAGSYRSGWIMLTIVEVLRFLGEQADELLQKSYTDLEARAMSIQDGQKQQMFWQKIPSHHAIQRLRQQLDGD